MSKKKLNPRRIPLPKSEVNKDKIVQEAMKDDMYHAWLLFICQYTVQNGKSPSFVRTSFFGAKRLLKVTGRRLRTSKTHNSRQFWKRAVFAVEKSCDLWYSTASSISFLRMKIPSSRRTFEYEKNEQNERDCVGNRDSRMRPWGMSMHEGELWLVYDCRASLYYSRCHP